VAQVTVGEAPIAVSHDRQEVKPPHR
jgi:hypothetical protein